MLNKVVFLGRGVCETIGPWPDWAVISVTDPISAFGEARLKNGWHDVLRLEFHDAEAADADSFVLMTQKDALTIVKFVREVAPAVEGVVVHCNSGISRSAAIAKWVADEYRIPFDSAYEQYNKHVYQMPIEAGKTL